MILPPLLGISRSLTINRQLAFITPLSVAVTSIFIKKFELGLIHTCFVLFITTFYKTPDWANTNMCC